MSKYIRIDEAKERTTQLFHGYEVEQWLETLPSIDIVRCKECKYTDFCEKKIHRHGIAFDIDFCSYGERQTERSE